MVDCVWLFRCSAVFGEALCCWFSCQSMEKVQVFVVGGAGAGRKLVCERKACHVQGINS